MNDDNTINNELAKFCTALDQWIADHPDDVWPECLWPNYSFTETLHSTDPELGGIRGVLGAIWGYIEGAIDGPSKYYD